MNSIPKIILENPFRILGVFANSPKKEIVANKGKATKFLQVGRDVDYPLDLKAFMPKVERSVDIFNQADAALAIAKGQLKYAQFWYVKSTPLDDVAFNHLFAGDTQQAIEIWNKKDCASSLQNKMVCYYCNGDIDSAINIAEDLYEKFSDDFLKIADTTGTLQLTQTDLVQMYLDTLSAEVDPMRIFNTVWSQDWKDYLGSKTVKPIIDRINAEIKIAKDVDDDNPKTIFDAGVTLYNNTKNDFKRLKSIFTAEDPKLESIADKLGLQILQCAINYYNNSDDEEAAENAITLQQAASKIVMGEMAKDRCEDNGNILSEIITSLPPKEIRDEFKSIENEITILLTSKKITLDKIIALLENTKYDIVAIKEKIGKNHSIYIEMSTKIAEVALRESIRIFNEIQASEGKNINSENYSVRENAISTLQYTFQKVWEIMLWISLLDSDADFKSNKLKPNKDTLKDILDGVNAFMPFTISYLKKYSFDGCCKDVKVDSYTYYTEEELYHFCCNVKIHTTSKSLESLAFKEEIKLYDLYLQRYSENKDGSQLSEERLKRIKTIEQKKQQQLEDRKRKEEERKRKEEVEDKKFFQSCRKLDDYSEYLRKYPNGIYADKAKEIVSKHIDRKLKMESLLHYTLIALAVIGGLILIGVIWGIAAVGVLFGTIAFFVVLYAIGCTIAGEESRNLWLAALVLGLLCYFISFFK